jgi:hypothetical protein
MSGCGVERSNRWSVITIHAMGVVTMALVGVRIRVGLETRSLGLQLAVPIVIGVVGALGLLLAGR